MEILKWRETYETGITEMDDQHRRLVHLVNQMYTIIRDKDGYEALDGILQEMSDYAEQHLGDEEQLLEKHSYPELAAQKTSHQEYLTIMGELLKEMESDRNGAAQKIYTFLRHWWINHIVGEDKAYGSFLREKGVS